MSTSQKANTILVLIVVYNIDFYGFVPM